MKFEEIISIYLQMKKNGAVLYGAGKEGKLALEVLTDEKIEVLAIGDKNTEVMLGPHKCVSLDELCEFDQHTVCIVTPLLPMNLEKERLRKHFHTVISNNIVHLIKYFIPQEEHLRCFPFNHYESPYLTVQELNKISNDKSEINGVDLNEIVQLKILDSIETYYYEFVSFLNTPIRYKIHNSYYGFEDVLVLYSFMRKYEPKNIIEIGSGLSTCAMLDTNERYFKNKIHIRCIEPYPDRLLANLNGKEMNLKISQSFVQDIPLDTFELLEKNDILFIDSSHVAKVGGDIPYEYFEIFPRLKSGVIIHIHDIFYPFTYPEQWLKEGICYNEAFILRALLTNNGNYEILYFNNMMHEKLVDCVKSDFGSGSSIWIRKI